MQPKGTKRNCGQPRHTGLALTWSMVASFREQGPGIADIGRMKRSDFGPILTTSARARPGDPHKTPWGVILECRAGEGPAPAPVVQT